MRTYHTQKIPQLKVSNVLATAQYYQDVLNFQVFIKDTNKIVLERDEFKFELIQMTENDTKEKSNCSLFDIIWFLPSLDEFYEEILIRKKAFKDRLKTKLEERIYGQRQIEIEDCDGHKILISE